MMASSIAPAENPTLLTMRQGQQPLHAWVAETSQSLRAAPGNAQERWLLFQLLCVMGDWTRALKQLQIWATLPQPATRADTAQLYRGLIQSELFRAEVFAGIRQPGFIHAAPPWVATLLQANAAQAQGDLTQSDALRSQAFDLAPATGGIGAVTGPFTWLADSDTRLGPVCEIAVSGGYRWIPFEHVTALSVTAPVSLLDLIWCQTTITLFDQTKLQGYMPARYPGSESGSDEVRLGRTTIWTDSGETSVTGLGQKTWSTDQGDWGVLELGACRFEGEHGSS